MKLQKKLLSLVAAGLLVFGVAACEGGTTDDTTVDPTTDTGTGTDVMPTPTDEATE